MAFSTRLAICQHCWAHPGDGVRAQVVRSAVAMLCRRAERVPLPRASRVARRLGVRDHLGLLQAPEL
eukprot:800169-Pyramimonas_sp.AAC.1